MWGNCFTFAMRLRRKLGGYIAFRATRHKHWWPIIKFHALWHPENCPEKDKPCPYWVSLIPRWKQEKKFPPPFFDGEVKQGDEED